jgi:hypothetical protein
MIRKKDFFFAILQPDKAIADYFAGISIVAIEDTFPEDITPFGLLLFGPGIKIANNMVSIDEHHPFFPAVQ